MNEKTSHISPKRLAEAEANRKSLLAVLLIVATVTTTQAEPRQSKERNRNYIPRRQQVVPGLGTPTTRLIYGKREIDVYRNGLMFERDHVVGVRGTR